MLGIPEVGTLGGGPAIEAAERAFILNTVEPLQGILLDQINFNIVNGAPGSFGITDWRVAFKNPDFRDSMTRAREAQLKIETGIWSHNEARAKSNDGDDRKPVEGGDRQVMTFRGLLIPVDELDQISYVSATGIETDQSGVASGQATPAVPQSTNGKKPGGGGGDGGDGAAKQSMLGALWLWERKALNRVKDGRSALVAFDAIEIPHALQVEVERQLAPVAKTKSVALVREAFAKALRIYEGTHEQPKFAAQRQAALAQRFSSWDRDQFDSAADTYLKSGDS